jgi:hypothetical protein
MRAPAWASGNAIRLPGSWNSMTTAPRLCCGLSAKRLPGAEPPHHLHTGMPPAVGMRGSGIGDRFRYARISRQRPRPIGSPPGVESAEQGRHAACTDVDQCMSARWRRFWHGGWGETVAWLRLLVRNPPYCKSRRQGVSCLLAKRAEKKGMTSRSIYEVPTQVMWLSVVAAWIPAVEAMLPQIRHRGADRG